MPENSNIYEITRMMSDQDVLKKDLQDAFKLVQDFFYKKYMRQIENEVKVQTLKVQKNPVREIQLLNTMKLFADEEMHPQLDNLISVLTTVNALSSIKKEVFIPKAKQEQVKVQSSVEQDPSVKSDGVYDIDDVCASSRSFSYKDDFIWLIIVAMGAGIKAF